MQLCDAWQWRQPNGTPCDAIRRGLLLWLHRAGHIRLPPPQWTTRKPWRPRTSAPPVLLDTTPIDHVRSGALGPVVFHQVRRTPDEALFNSLLAQHHYLGYQQPVGEHLKYLVVAGDRPVACFAWGSAPGALRLRDRFIGWSADARRPSSATPRREHALSDPAAGEVPIGLAPARADGEAALDRLGTASTSHPIYWLETFIDPARFRGTCYRAANWIVL